jgi:hypothetical protein
MKSIRSIHKYIYIYVYCVHICDGQWRRPGAAEGIVWLKVTLHAAPHLDPAQDQNPIQITSNRVKRGKILRRPTTPTLEPTQGKIWSQSPTDATSRSWHWNGSWLKKPLICPWVVSRVDQHCNEHNHTRTSINTEENMDADRNTSSTDGLRMSVRDHDSLSRANSA